MDKKKYISERVQKTQCSIEIMKKNLCDIYTKEFNDKLTNCLILSEEKFLDSIRKEIKKDFETNFKKNPNDLKELSSLVYSMEEEIISSYRSINELVNKSLNLIMTNKKEVFLTEFKKHCNMTGDYAIHQCEGKMLPIYDNDVVKYVICETCKELYKPDSMLLYCYFCSCNYSSNILSYKWTDNILPATWEHNHCEILVSDVMRCIKCKDIFYLNINENVLYCKSCKFTIDPFGIIWQCIYCKQDYKSAAKIYNHLDYKIIKNFIIETLNIKQKAKPLTVPCCKVGVYDYIFFHKKACDGELFQGELNKVTMILCEKCKMIYPYDKFTWTCPNCFKRFRKTLKHSNLKLNISPEIVKHKKSLHDSISIDDKTPKLKDNNLLPIRRQSSNNDLPILINDIQDIKNSEDQKQLIFNNIVLNNFSSNNQKAELKNSKNYLNIKVNNLNSSENENNNCSDRTFEDNYSYSTEEVRKQEIKIKENVEFIQNLVTFFVEDYKILQTIGEGSYGVIYLVQEIKTGTKLAMKKIIINNESQLTIFTNEYEIVNQIQHTNVLKLKGLSHKKLDETTNVLYILMELAKTDWEKEIKHRASNKNYYSEEELINIIKQLSDALFYLQEKNIAHRDIKPQNILIFEHKVFKLADFGEAKEVKLLAQKHRGTLRGTELYMAPTLFNSLDLEQAVEHNPYKSDVFSLGYCVLLAATLSFNVLYELRKLTNQKMIQSVINKYLSNKYSSKFTTLMCRMVEYNEKYRFDFIHLKSFLEKTVYSE